MTGKETTTSITFIISLLVFLLYLVYRIGLIFYPMQDAGGVEGNILYFIQRLLDGQSFYTDPEQPPYAIAQYSPGYYYIVTAVAKIFSTGPDDLLRLYEINRVLGLVFNLSYIAVVYRIARNVFSLPSMKSAIISFSAFIFLEISSYARPDSLYHFLFMLALYLFMLSIKRQQENKNIRKLIIASAFIAAMALFAKQTAFILPVITGIWMLWQKKYRNLLVFIIAYLLSLLAFMALVYFFLDIRLFYKNAILGINNGISPGWFRNAIFYPFYCKAGLLFTGMFAGVLFFMSKEKEPLLRFARYLLIMLFGLLNFIVLKNGANPGYLTEWWTMVFILTGLYAEGIAAVFQQIKLPATVPLVVLCICLLAKPILSWPTIKNTISPSGRAAALDYYQQQKAFAQEVQHRFASNDRYVLFLNIYTPDSYLANLLFRNTITPQMDIVILASYPLKKYDYTDFEKSLGDGRIKWMIAHEKGPQLQFFSLKLDKFERVFNGAGYNLYQYKPR